MPLLPQPPMQLRVRLVAVTGPWRAPLGPSLTVRQGLRGVVQGRGGDGTAVRAFSDPLTELPRRSAFSALGAGAFICLCASSPAGEVGSRCKSIFFPGSMSYPMLGCGAAFGPATHPLQLTSTVVRQ